MEPNIHISFLAIGLAVVAHFIIGFVWYTPLFGKIWAKEMGFSRDMPVSKSFFIRSILLNLFGNLLLAWVLAHNIAAWNPKTWGVDASFVSPAMSAISSALFTWLGFFLPQNFTGVTWEMKSWKLFLINASYQLIALLVVAFILVFVK